MLPAELSGLRFAFRFMDRPVEFVYHLAYGEDNRITVNGADVPVKQTPNRYRQGGMRVSRELLAAALTSERNEIGIYIRH